MRDTNENTPNTQFSTGSLLQAKEICKRYAANRKEVESWNNERLRLENVSESFSQPEQKMLAKNYMNALENKTAETMKKMLLFETALLKCDSKTAHIMRQVYGKKIKWNKVCDEKGEPIGKATISRARSKALKIIADLIDNGFLESEHKEVQCQI